MKFFDFLKSRAMYYITLACFGFFLYLIIPNSTPMGFIIGVMLSEIKAYFGMQTYLQTYLHFQDRMLSEIKEHLGIQRYLAFQDSVLDEIKEHLGIQRYLALKHMIIKKHVWAFPLTKPRINFDWIRIIVYILILLAIWIISNLYLHFTIK